MGRKGKTNLVGSEIFELDEEVGECAGHLKHKFFHELNRLFHWYSWLAEAEVERVFQEFLVVGSNVETYWYS